MKPIILIWLLALFLNFYEIFAAKIQDESYQMNLPLFITSNLKYILIRIPLNIILISIDCLQQKIITNAKELT